MAWAKPALLRTALNIVVGSGTSGSHSRTGSGDISTAVYFTLLSTYTMVRMQRCCAVQRYACSTLLYGTPRSTMPAYSDLSSCGCGSWVVAVGTVSRCIAIAVVEGSSVCFPLTPNVQCTVPFIPAALRGGKRGASLSPLDCLVLFSRFCYLLCKDQCSLHYTTPHYATPHTAIECCTYLEVLAYCCAVGGRAFSNRVKW